jgi:hypothetical protein
MALIDKRAGSVDAVDPDLGDFRKRGGKLLLYAGWGDTTITPENTVLYMTAFSRRWDQTRPRKRRRGRTYRPMRRPTNRRISFLPDMTSSSSSRKMRR